MGRADMCRRQDVLSARWKLDDVAHQPSTSSRCDAASPHRPCAEHPIMWLRPAAINGAKRSLWMRICGCHRGRVSGAGYNGGTRR
jgi:hypothetical protein